MRHAGALVIVKDARGRSFTIRVYGEEIGPAKLHRLLVREIAHRRLEEPDTAPRGAWRVDSWRSVS